MFWRKLHILSSPLNSNRGDVFILIALAISIAIFATVAGYQMLLAQNAKSNYLITESTETFLHNENTAWSGYFRSQAGLVPFPEDGTLEETPKGQTSAKVRMGNFQGAGPAKFASGRSRGKEVDGHFCASSPRGAALCIGRTELGAGSGGDETTEELDALPDDGNVVTTLSTVPSADKFGTSLAVSGDTLVVGVPYEDSNQKNITNGGTSSTDESLVDSGAAFVYRKSGDKWVQEAYIKAPNASSRAYFGSSVVIDGDMIAITAPRDDSSQIGIIQPRDFDTSKKQRLGTGAVYVYKRTDRAWTLQSFIKIPDSVSGQNRFAAGLALRGDTLAVSAPHSTVTRTIKIYSGYSHPRDFNHAGAVYIYRLKSDIWKEEARLTDDLPGRYDFFGASIALSTDTIAIGAPSEGCDLRGIQRQCDERREQNGFSSHGLNKSGAVFVFKRNLTHWNLEQYLKSSAVHSNRQYRKYRVSHSNSFIVEGGFFGAHLAFDGNSLAIAEPGIEELHLYEKNNSLWSLGQSISTSNIVRMSPNLALARDKLIIADYSAKFNMPGRQSVSSVGETMIYHKSKSGWTKISSISPGNPSQGDYFGRMAYDGTTLVIGAPEEDSRQRTINNNSTSAIDNQSRDAGAVYVFKPKDNNWEQEAYIKASNTYQKP